MKMDVQPLTLCCLARNRLVGSGEKPRRAVETGDTWGENFESMRVEALVPMSVDAMLQNPNDWIRPGFVLKPDTEELDWNAQGGAEGCSG